MSWYACLNSCLSEYLSTTHDSSYMISDTIRPKGSDMFYLYVCFSKTLWLCSPFYKLFLFCHAGWSAKTIKELARTPQIPRSWLHVWPLYHTSERMSCYPLRLKNHFLSGIMLSWSTERSNHRLVAYAHTIKFPCGFSVMTNLISFSVWSSWNAYQIW